MIAWIADLTFRFGGDTEHKRVRRNMAWGLAHFCHVVDSSDRYLTDEQVRQLRYSGRVYLDGYAWLAREAHDLHVTHWLWRPKHHQFEHLLDELLVCAENPRFYWNYADEDFIGHIVKTSRATHPWTRCTRTLGRYAIGLGLIWAGRGNVPFGVPLL